ncbi:hypothetical protein E2C01_015137 [Portunus trituberculatus]|uniref:Uncharacterized protein n=1 Tax=Portunus trituberculatus TaxID=210409 RepID=A0A5B7DKW1_PORTR|nr:hypothetical protein [Portunus trituberculatus]
MLHVDTSHPHWLTNHQTLPSYFFQPRHVCLDWNGQQDWVEEAVESFRSTVVPTNPPSRLSVCLSVAQTPQEQLEAAVSCGEGASSGGAKGPEECCWCLLALGTRYSMYTTTYYNIHSTLQPICTHRQPKTHVCTTTLWSSRMEQQRAPGTQPQGHHPSATKWCGDLTSTTQHVGPQPH